MCWYVTNHMLPLYKEPEIELGIDICRGTFFSGELIEIGKWSETVELYSIQMVHDIRL